MRAPLSGHAFFMPLATFVALLTLTPRVAMSAARTKAPAATRSQPATPRAATRSPPATPPAVPRSPQARAHVVSLFRFCS